MALKQIPEGYEIVRHGKMSSQQAIYNQLVIITDELKLINTNLQDVVKAVERGSRYI